MAPKIGDHKPFSLFPEYFSTTMKPRQSPLDIPRYMGKWFEICRMPQTFQKGMKKCEANYSYNSEKGFVTVLNKGLKKDGEWTEGKAKAYPQNEFSTYLKVYFSRFFGAPYFILDLDDDYKWVLVGEPSRSYMWILSRSEEMEPELLERLKQKGKDYGYDITKLIYRNETD